ncbi:hypothetical protein JTE90_000231 [Oedothorax gibbosus]|uniref:Spaetzle domain-containing protein n=1 Tax=Oedothorax gibbosus TaxID=931172 RepID=A0AAV6VAW3_9ARAC|nr:hypothetical protein JTE90_000231 [Oedothorax gibbosus]
MDTSLMMRLSLLTFLAQFCFLLGTPASWRSYQPKPLFQPGPQFCPDTGRTVCTAVDYYPTDQIYHLLMSSRSQVFNLTSLFVDERKGDMEPNLAQLPTPQPDYQDGGYGNQDPPPGGRFSPAGRWDAPTSDKPPEMQPDRWRQNTNRPGMSSSPYFPSFPQSRGGQDTPDQRRNFVTQRFNYNERSTKINNRPNNNQEGNLGPFDNSRIDPQQQNVNQYGNQPQPFSNITRFFPQDVPAQEPHHIQPPQTPYGVKGRDPGISMRPQQQPVVNWKGSPHPSGAQGNLNSRFTRRERSNEDVEVACRVRSTYVPPRAALSDNSEWKYIINVPERDRRFTQVVRVDICQNPGDPCSSRLSLPFGFESRCRQKYIKKKLLSLNSDGQGTSEDNFFIPSCCVCEIVRQNNIGTPYNFQ